MKIAALLKNHQNFQQKGLAGNFGDGYLMEHNRVYRQIRKAALAGGYKFSSDPNGAYEVFPLLQLERLLKAKIFPYSNNVRVFEEMPPSQLEVLVWDDLVGNLKRNFVFHEGCHGVIRDLVSEHFGKDPQPSVWQMLLEESFANTAELLGIMDVDNATHRAFYELNSYNTLFEHRTGLKKAMDELGSNVLIPFLLLSYLHVNFLRDSLDEGDLKKILSLIEADKPTANQLKILKFLAKLTFELSEIFRYQTTAFHLKINGITSPLEEALDFDFLEELKKQNKLSSFFKEVCGCLL